MDNNFEDVFKLKGSRPGGSDQDNKLIAPLSAA